MAVIKVIEIIGGISILLPSKRALAITPFSPCFREHFLSEVCTIGAFQASESP
jgi:hypothetical protein